jgi:hypothetical protein
MYNAFILLSAIRAKGFLHTMEWVAVSHNERTQSDKVPAARVLWR